MSKKKRTFATDMKKTILLALAATMMACAPKYQSLSMDEFEKAIAEPNVAIVDVRTPLEYAESHIEGAINIDWKAGDFDKQAIMQLPDKNQTIAVYCIHAHRSKKAAACLDSLGYKHVIELADGFEGWLNAGKPIIKDNMNYQTTNPEGMQEVCQFVKDCGYYMIATAEGDQPRVRPFGTIHIYDGKLYIQTGHRKRTAQQLAKNGKAEICAINKEGNKWIRISGTLVEDMRVEAKKSMLDDYPELRGMYDENDDNTAVYFFTDGVAYLSSFTEAEKEIRF